MNNVKDVYISDLEKINNVIFLLFLIATMLCIILLCNFPREENGCIELNDKIYCELKGE
jgi:hypothetical protein